MQTPGGVGPDLASLGGPVRRDEGRGRQRLKELEKQNQRLKKIVADQTLDIDMLKELNRGNW